MKTSKITFEIYGEIIHIRNNDNYEEHKILEFLNENSRLIIKETISDIQGFLYKYEVQNINIDLNFRKGSIIADGLVVLDIISSVSGTIAMLGYLSRLINNILKKNIQKRLRDQDDRYKIILTINPISYPYLEKKPEENLVRVGFLDFFNNWQWKLLLVITSLNIIFFVGGTIFNTFQIQNIQDKMEKANEKIALANEKYQTAANELALTKSNYLNDYYEIERLANRLKIKKDSISETLDKESLKLFNDVENSSREIIHLNEEIKNLKTKISLGEKELKLINKQIHDEKIKFSFKDIWIHMNGFLRFIFIILCVIPFFVITSIIYNFVRDLIKKD